MILDVSNIKKEYLSQLLEHIVSNISVSKSAYDNLRQHFNGLTKVLEEGINPTFQPVLRTQGSVRIGTANKPLSEEGLDADIICELHNVPIWYTQKDVQEIVGKVLRNHSDYKDKLKDPEGGRRCFTIEYADGTHVDILPCVVDDSYRRHINESSSNPFDYILKITDKKAIGFDTDTDRNNWKKSNPIGYAKIFIRLSNQRGKILLKEDHQLRALIEPFPEFKDGDKKTPLQSITQLFKRHRDKMMGSDDDKPISILITTLIEKAYVNAPSDCLFSTIIYVAEHLKDGITFKNNRPVVLNPALEEENFADKWPEKTRKKEMFDKWCYKLSEDLKDLSRLQVTELSDKLKEMFGEIPVTAAFVEKAKFDHQSALYGNLKMSNTNGQWSNLKEGYERKPHTFYQEKKQNKRI